MINAKRKGNKGENAWANWLRDNGIKAWRDNASGGGSREKSDVGNSLGYSFEIKTCKKINLKRAWNQSVTAANKTYTLPVVVTHFDGMPKDQWLITIDNHHFLELLQLPNQPTKVEMYQGEKIPIKIMTKEKKNYGEQCKSHKRKMCTICHYKRAKKEKVGKSIPQE